MPRGVATGKRLGGCAAVEGLHAAAAEWLRARLLASRQHGIEQLWNRAVSRGEVREDIDPDIAIDLLFGPVMWRLMSGRGPLTEDQADRITDAALNGLLRR
jgi:hypothetical protein